MRAAFVIPLSILSLFGFAVNGFGAGTQKFVKLNLTVTQTNFPPGTSALQQKTATWTATCTFGQGRWLIETHFVPNAVETYYCDGTNVFDTVKIWTTPEMADEITKQMAKAGIMMPPIRVGNGDDLPLRLHVSSGTHPLSEFVRIFLG